jgi:MYXO-CTERM domain-containing protein
MATRSTTTFLSGAIVWFASSAAEAATPTYYNDQATFLADVTDNVLDDYSNPGYVFNQSNVQMSGVLGETDYESTGHMNINIVNGGYYCAGCNGSFELSFLTTSMGEPEGVNGVGFTIATHDVMNPYFAYITFADGTTADIQMPASGNFWGVTAPERIERIHLGLSMGGTTVGGSFGIDDLIIGDGFDETPCGDGIATPDEECDDMGQSAGCDTNCTLALCGDGTFNMLAGEECDAGGASPLCNADCTAPFCGDGLVNMQAGEDCDDGAETATCNIDCTVPMCGDDVINALAGEVCDDGGLSPGCDDDCTLVECGDGTENNLAGEYCDDGNLIDGDGCSATCTNEEVETDDDGGESSGDGSGTDGGESTGAVADTGGSGDAETGADASSAGDTATDVGESDSGGASASASATDPDSATASASDADGESSSSGDSGAANDDDSSGCSCTTDASNRRDDAWIALGLLGLGALTRRRRVPGSTRRAV